MAHYVNDVIGNLSPCIPVIAGQGMPEQQPLGIGELQLHQTATPGKSFPGQKEGNQH